MYAQADLGITLLVIMKWLVLHIIAFPMMCSSGDVLCHYFHPPRSAPVASMLTAVASLESIWTCKGIKLSLA